MSPPPMSKSNLHPWENGSWLMIKSSLVRPHLGQSGCHLKSLEALLDGMKYVEIFIGKPFNQASCVTADLSAFRQTEPPALRLHALLCWFSLKGLYAHLLLVYFIWTNFKGRLTGKLYIFPYYWRGICSFVVREIIIYIFFVIEKAFVYLIFSLRKHLWDLVSPSKHSLYFLVVCSEFFMPLQPVSAEVWGTENRKRRHDVHCSVFASWKEKLKKKMHSHVIGTQTAAFSNSYHLNQRAEQQETRWGRRRSNCRLSVIISLPSIFLSPLCKLYYLHKLPVNECSNRKCHCSL